MSATPSGRLSSVVAKGRSMNSLLGRGRSIRLGRVCGIPLAATPSWFVANALVIVFLAAPLARLLDTSSAGGYLAAAVFALLSAASILLHELGHALAARRLGIPITGIDLWIFGGVARLARGWASPAIELKVIAPGPAVTLVLFLVSGALTALLTDGLSVRLLLIGAPAGSSDVPMLLSLLVPINFALLVFNLVPAYPLDGGLLMHALIWKRTGNHLRATVIAGRGGQGFAAVLILAGAVLLTQGAPISGVSLAVVGWMLGQAAHVAVGWSLGIGERIDGMTAADVMDSGPVALALPETMTAIRARDDFFKPHGWTYFPVVDELARLVGVVTLEDVERAVAAGRSSVEMRELVDAGDTGRWCVRPDRPLHALLLDGHLAEHGSLLVLDDDGILRGVVTTLQLRLAVQPPAEQPAA